MAVLLINGVERSTYLADWAPLSTTKTLNGRAKASFTLNPGYIPTRFWSVAIYEDDGTTLRFGGFVLTRRVQGVMPGHGRAFTRVDCADTLALADYCFTTRTYTVATDVEDVIDDLVTDHLAAYGISYTPAATGLQLEPFAWNRKRVSDALRAITDATGIVLNLSPAGVLTVLEPGDDAAPISITTAAMHSREVSWQDDAKVPANTIHLVCGIGQAEGVQSFVTDGLAHGGTTYYVTDYPASQDYGGLWPNVIHLDGVPVPVGWKPLTPGFEFVWDPVNHRLEHDDTTFGVQSAGIVISNVNYTKQFPFVVSATTGGSPVIEAVEVREDIFTIEFGQQVVDGLLAQAIASPPVHVLTREGLGVEPGQSMAVNITNRGTVNDTFHVASVTQTLLRGDREYTIDLTPGVTAVRNPIDRLRALLGRGGSGSGGSSTVSASVATVTAAAAGFAMLGGSRNTSVAPVAGTWVLVPEGMDYAPSTSYTGLVRVRLRAAAGGVGVTARFRNVTDATDVQSAEVTSTAETLETFVVTIEAGKTYQLEITSDTSGARIYGLGSVQPLG